MRLILFLIIPIFVTACSSEKNDDILIPSENPLFVNDSNSVDSTDIEFNPAYSFELFETPDLGWGYKIFENGTLFINQPHIPAIPGNKGFSSKEKAEITAEFAILKMEQGFVPPTISPEELDSLGVLN
jgi:hypothetical protein